MQETLHLHPPSEMKKSCFAYNSQTSPSAKKYCGNYSCFQKLCFLWIRQQRGQGWGAPLKVTEALRTLDRRAALPDIPRQGVSSMSRRDKHVPLSVPPEPFLFTFLTLPLSHESYVIKCQLRDTSLVTWEYCASQPCCWKSSRQAHSICLDDEHQEYFCRPDRVEENLSPNQHLFSLVLYAFALVFFLCVNSIGGISFTVCRCTGHCWTGGLCLKPPDMAVLGANISLAKAIAWGEVAECRRCTYTARNQVVSQGCHGECTVRCCS